MRDKKLAAQSVLRVKGSSSVRGKFFAQIFSVIQFWQIWQNDLFKEKLEYGHCIVSKRVTKLKRTSVQYKIFWIIKKKKVLWSWIGKGVKFLIS